MTLHWYLFRLNEHAQSRLPFPLCVYAQDAYDMLCLKLFGRMDVE